MSNNAATKIIDNQELSVPDHTELEIRQDFINTMAGAPTAVTLVAYEGETGITGQTVSAFASVTADPPTVLVCINQRSPLQAVLEPGAVFSINLLAPSQDEIANSFAGVKGENLEPYDVAAVDWGYFGPSVPYVKNATGSLKCRVDSHLIQGTHGVIIARVLDSRTNESEPLGLAYCRREYRKMI